jgi:imidazolonepropionase-like amidohydrolase
MSSKLRVLWSITVAGALAATLAGGCGDNGNTPVGGGGGDGGASRDDGGGGSADGGDGGASGPKITMCPMAGMPALPSGTCQVTAGSTAKLITAQSVLTPGEVFRGGQVLVDDAGKIACVGCDCTANAAGATQITCPTGVLSPGLINSHDHISFQSSPGVDSGERFEQRNDWRKGLRGHGKLSSGSTATTAQVRWAELRFILGGATSTVGSGGTAGFLRNLDKADPLQEGLGQKAVDFDTFPLGDTSGTQLSMGCGYPAITSASQVMGDDAYYPHVSEGVDQVARNEFLCESTSMNGGQDLSQPQSAFIHAIGLTAPDYSLMASASVSLVWSPRSNVRLYGNTAQVTEAARMGVLVALGTDWVLSGSMNLLRELQCADSLNATYYDHYFTDEQLWLMVTQNAAVASATDDVIGTIKAGLYADLTIFDGASRVDHRAVLDAAPQDVALVLRAGKPLYGDADLVGALAQNCDALDVCSHPKVACVQAETGQSLATLMSSLPAGNYPLFFCGPATNEPSCTPARPKTVNGSTVYDGMPSASDTDGDGIPDAMDNCPKLFNPIRPVDNGAQADFDGDGLGDVCDPCPMVANSTTCQMFDPNDNDGDGIPNAVDNCPMTPNMDQADGDMDGKGDACDACPADANPGNQGCPATVYAIKSGQVPVNRVVAVKNLLVTGKSASGFFAQVKTGDAGDQGPANSGVFVYQKATTVKSGDRVDLPSATVTNYFGQIELTNPTVMVTSSGEAPPAPVTTDPSGGAPLTAAGLVAAGQSLDGVVVQLQNVRVTDINPPLGAGDTAPANEFVVDGALRVNDFLFGVGAPQIGDLYTTLGGVFELRNGNFKLEPRDASDATLGPPQLASVGPDGFARVNLMGGDAIPSPLQVSLTRAATAPTVISLSSSDASVAVPPTVTIPMGSISTPIKLTTGATPPGMPVTVTAALSGVLASGHVQVIDTTAQPAAVTLTPGQAGVSVGGSVTLTVTLDIPAPSGGTQVMLSSAPGGVVPSSVTVLADQRTATFTYTQSGAAGTDTLTATLGGSSASAMITATMGHIVINEIDYDQPGTDTDEFIELYNPTGAAIDLSKLAVVLINGGVKPGKEYARIPLSGTLQPDSYLVIASSTVSVDLNATLVPFGVASNNIQNGNPDGVCILDTSSGQIVDALSYGGAITAASLNGVTNAVSLVEGTVLATTVVDSNSVVRALIRNPNGQDADNANADWTMTATPTPGAPNIKN